MPFVDIGAVVSTNITGTEDNFSVADKVTDAPTTGEYKYFFNKFSKYLGYYKTIPELRAAIDVIATWTIGKGFTADDETTFELEGITGYKKDTFNTILENMIRTMYINGDAFAEIIRDGDTLVNLKPIDPSSIVIVAERGLIKRYEQITKVEGQANKKFNVDNIFHLARNRLADEVHGMSLIESLEPIILARNEAMDDMKTLMHRHVKPMRIWRIDTDDASRIATFKATIDDVHKKTENLVIPKGTVEHELVSVPQNATMSPLGWIRELNNYFFQAARVPQIIIGGSQELTEASAKIAYLAFQQTIEEEQLFVEEQTAIQLDIEINLEFPASLQNELLSDQRKDGQQSQNPNGFQPNETTAGFGQ